MSKTNKSANTTKTINTKVDIETKSKLDTLAYLKGMKLQDLCFEIITNAINENADAIAEVEKAKAKFKK